MRPSDRARRIRWKGVEQEEGDDSDDEQYDHGPPESTQQVRGHRCEREAGWRGSGLAAISAVNGVAAQVVEPDGMQIEGTDPLRDDGKPLLVEDGNPRRIVHDHLLNLLVR